MQYWATVTPIPSIPISCFLKGFQLWQDLSGQLTLLPCSKMPIQGNNNVWGPRLGPSSVISWEFHELHTWVGKQPCVTNLVEIVDTVMPAITVSVATIVILHWAKELNLKNNKLPTMSGLSTLPSMPTLAQRSLKSSCRSCKDRAGLPAWSYSLLRHCTLC